MWHAQDREHLLSFDELRAVGRDIRLHGNRFLQIDLDPAGRQRLHLWSDVLPSAQACPTPWHDHVFDFTSVVLSGELVDVRYKVYPAFASTSRRRLTYARYRSELRNGQDTQLIPVADVPECLLFPERVQHFKRGDRYRCAAGEIHASGYVGHAVTLFTKMPNDESARYPEYPVVFCPVGRQPDNSYDRYEYGEERLWNIVGHVLREIVER